MRSDEHRAADESAIRALYLQMMDGWNQGDAARFAAAPLTDDVDFIAFDGHQFHGRAELEEFHEPLFKTHLKGTRLVGDVTSIRFLSPDIALMHARGGTILKGRSSPAPERDSVQTMVAERREGRWWITAFQNTRVRPIGESFGGTLLWLVTDPLWGLVLPRRRR